MRVVMNCALFMLHIHQNICVARVYSFESFIIIMTTLGDLWQRKKKTYKLHIFRVIIMWMGQKLAAAYTNCKCARRTHAKVALTRHNKKKFEFLLINEYYKIINLIFHTK